MFGSKVIIFLVSVFCACECFFVDTVPKCSVHDSKCHKKYLEIALKEVGENGIPELNIPPADPMSFSNLKVTVLDLLQVIITKGQGKGLKTCVVDKFETNIEAGTARVEITCDITVKGQVKIDSLSPLVKELLGGEDIYCNGSTKVTLEKFHMAFDFVFSVVKHSDGKFYIKCNKEKAKYSYDNKGSVHFQADNIYVGGQEISKVANGLVNDNPNFFMKTVGKYFVEKAYQFSLQYVGIFFNVIPLEQLVTEDMSSYVKG